MPNLGDSPALDEVIEKTKQIKQLLLLLGSSAAKHLRAAMHACNDKANGSYPLAHEFMARSIDGKGAIKYGANSKIAKAILASAEFKKLVGKQKGSCQVKPVTVLFSSNRDLARSIYAGAVSGKLEIKDKSWSFDGKLTDTYDFRFDLIPKKMTVRGFMLRQAGNIAWACQELGLMSSYKVTVTLQGSGKL